MSESPIARKTGEAAFPMTDVERFLVGTLIPTAAAPGKWAALSAVRHLHRAWRLREWDPEMAVFRAITSEEESATALFHALRRRRYVGAEKLDPRDHIQKNAVAPFLDAVGAALAPAVNALYRGLRLTVITSEKKPRLRVRIIREVGGQEFIFEPVPPLHLEVRHSRKENEPAQVWDFAEKIFERALARGADTVMEDLKKWANIRNRLLYAAPNGLPEVPRPINAGLARATRRTLRNLKLFHLIDAYPSGQLFAQQCLTAFLKMVKRAPKDVEFR
jgi:hypothetical protein